MSSIATPDIHAKRARSTDIQKCDIRFVIEAARVCRVGGVGDTGKHAATAAARTDQAAGGVAVVDIEAPDLSAHVANKELVCQLLCVQHQSTVALLHVDHPHSARNAIAHVGERKRTCAGNSGIRFIARRPDQCTGPRVDDVNRVADRVRSADRASFVQ
ncbi:hypothetical protein D9M69_561420 [compost metagenome]